MFQDRQDAAMQLAEKLKTYKNDPASIVLAIPRGGVIIADVVCEQLNLPMDIVVTRKLGAPYNEELAIGAVDSRGGTILNHNIIFRLRVPEAYIEIEAKRKAEEARTRLKQYRGTDEYESLSDKNAIVVDDGIATGYTVMSAINFLKGLKPKKLILATPVIAPDTRVKMEKIVDELICVKSEDPFYSVGQFYYKFFQVTDSEIMDVLAKRRFPRQ
ncbi:MAG: phosphoribosyltransferase family protein [Tepidanaerobacteraceae bacterium]|jgi:putative phosphoribosyl transferase|nr:phosphoribosyltransferase family protein [Tepidanaerobacteraceae bacterium]HQE06310.1 phosphoribosyltransferase family protein [Tepidanaerobacteraceae bacterium]